MQKEIDPTRTELDALAGCLAKTFIQRWDIHARQTDDGGYICIRKPLQMAHLIDHLQGKITLGAYLLDPSSRVHYIVLEADMDEQMERLAALSADLESRGIPSYLENSRRGGHLWLFFPQPIPGKDARRFGRRLLEYPGLAGVELFPKQDRTKGGPGSLIRLPFGVHRRSGQRYGFLTPQGQPLAASLADQVHILSAPRTVPGDVFQSFLTIEPPGCEKPPPVPIERPTDPLSTRIKDSVTVLDFIGRYIELSPSGRGRCPFHDDQHASFAVSIEGNYWSCFAGCGGGSLIDFWMRYQDCDFKTAVHQLANMLLKTG